MRRLLSGAAALAIASTIAFAGMASAAEEPTAPEAMQLPAVLINDEARMNVTPDKVDELIAELRQ